MAQVRPLKLSGNNRSQTDPAADEITFLSVTSPNFVAGDVVLRSRDGLAYWRLVEQVDHIEVINENTGQTSRLVTEPGEHTYAACRLCDVRAPRVRSVCTACGGENLPVIEKVLK